MEQALRVHLDDVDGAPSTGAKPAGETLMSEGIEKVLRFALPAKAAEAGITPAPMPTAAGFVTAREFAAAIDGVHEAAQAMRAAEERSREAEGRTQTLAQRATEELKAAEARIQSLEARLRAAENRAQEAETRAKEADAWLRQIFATIADELPQRKVG